MCHFRFILHDLVSLSHSLPYPLTHSLTLPSGCYAMDRYATHSSFIVKLPCSCFKNGRRRISRGGPGARDSPTPPPPRVARAIHQTPAGLPASTAIDLEMAAAAVTNRGSARTAAAVVAVIPLGRRRERKSQGIIEAVVESKTILAIRDSNIGEKEWDLPMIQMILGRMMMAVEMVEQR